MAKLTVTQLKKILKNKNIKIEKINHNTNSTPEGKKTDLEYAINFLKNGALIIEKWDDVVFVSSRRSWFSLEIKGA